jgi:hypothetical protein
VAGGSGEEVVAVTVGGSGSGGSDGWETVTVGGAVVAVGGSCVSGRMQVLQCLAYTV